MNESPLDPLAVTDDEELQLSSEQVLAVLAERATKLARAFDVPATAGDTQRQLIAFSRAGRQYAVDLGLVAEVKPIACWTPVPGVPSLYLGVIQLRGEIVALIDLVRLFGDAPQPPADEPVAVVLSARGAMVALLADAVDDVHDLDAGRVHPPLATFSHTRGRYISGLVEDGPAIIDAEKLLGDERLAVNQDSRA